MQSRASRLAVIRHMETLHSPVVVDTPTVCPDESASAQHLDRTTKQRDESRQSESYLATEHLVQDLDKRSVRGGIITLLSQHAKAVIDLCVQLALARILMPGDFGVVAMVIVVTRFASFVMDMGLSTATIQKDKLTEEQISTLFWTNAFVGVALAIALLAISPLVAWLYGEPRVIGIFSVLAFALIFGGLTVQHEALLRRQMNFKRLALCGVSAVAVAALVALALAVAGAGYWSLVMMHVAYSVTMAVGVWSACKWRPRRTMNLASIRSILAFGGRLTGFDLFDYAARNIDRVLVGLFWGARWVGLYAQAVELFLTSTTQICMPVSEVTIAGLSRLHDERERFRSYFLNALSFVLVIAIPIAVLFAVLARELLVTVLGEHWSDAASILRVLAICALFFPITRVMQWLYKATGRGRQMLRWGIFASLVSVVSFFVGIPFGVEAMSISFTICTGLLIVPCVYFATRDTGISAWEVWRTFARPFAAGLLAASAGLCIKKHVTAGWADWAALLLAGGTIIATYAFVLLYALGMKRQLISFWRAMRVHEVP